jgi:DnaK suppressor protein
MKNKNGTNGVHGQWCDAANGANAHGAAQKQSKNYRPTDKEPFMNERQREYFRQKLMAWREDILKEAKETLQHLQDENQNHPDLADRASSETDRAIELRARDRQRKLIAKIDAALSRIDDGTYGYCEETGEPISLKRLEARPIATLVDRGAGAARAARTRSTATTERLVGILFQPGYGLLEILRRHILVDGEQQWRIRHEGDRLKVLHQIVFELE